MLDKCRFCDREAEYAGLLLAAEEGDDEGLVCGDHAWRVSNPEDIFAYKIRRGRENWRRYVKTGKLS